MNNRNARIEQVTGAPQILPFDLIIPTDGCSIVQKLIEIYYIFEEI
jgi:hypothetical protein